jgi:hypothetical protein
MPRSQFDKISEAMQARLIARDRGGRQKGLFLRLSAIGMIVRSTRLAYVDRSRKTDPHPQIYRSPRMTRSGDRLRPIPTISFRLRPRSATARRIVSGN